MQSEALELGGLKARVEIGPGWTTGFLQTPDAEPGAVKESAYRIEPGGRWRPARTRTDICPGDTTVSRSEDIGTDPGVNNSGIERVHSHHGIVATVAHTWHRRGEIVERCSAVIAAHECLQAPGRAIMRLVYIYDLRIRLRYSDHDPAAVCARRHHKQRPRKPAIV